MKAYAVSIKGETEVSYFAAETCGQAKSVLHSILVDLGFRRLQYTDMTAKRAFEFDDIASKSGRPRSIHKEVMERKEADNE